jgi:hypothetical protein
MQKREPIEDWTRFGLLVIEGWFRVGVYSFGTVQMGRLVYLRSKAITPIM